MHIDLVMINNFRNFINFEAKLNKTTLIIGENNAGKSNFIKALSLPLNTGGLDYNQKKLSISDINTDAIYSFYTSILNKEDDFHLISKIPKVSITIQFDIDKDNFALQIVKNWLCKTSAGPKFRIKYEFKPKDEISFINYIKEIFKDITDIDEAKWFSLPIELYDYQIISVDNEAVIPFSELKNVTINMIGAERDDFSDANTMKSNSILTRLLVKELNDLEKKNINSAYADFFKTIEEADTFKRILNSDDSFKNIKEYLSKLECIPNIPNLKNILSNITLGYGDEFLYQKGLGERNLVYIFLFFAYFRHLNDSFNVCCIEEPEAHLGVNKLRLVIDFINKSANQDATEMLQTIITTHSPSAISKLNINNVLVFTGDRAVSFSDMNNDLNDYLRKRPNFDILKFLFANKVILVEGPSEEMLITAYLAKDGLNLSDIEVVSVGQKGYKTFLDIWLRLNENNLNKKIGIIRDFDDQETAKIEHDRYGENNKNIFISTTVLYTLEDDLVSTGNNCDLLSKYFSLSIDDCDDIDLVSTYLKDGKTDGMLSICDGILNIENPLNISMPKHILSVIQRLK
ncbi:ATP-dependent nuclease [Yersinia intermedia]|uniref:ATP-dependent nuclease n=1 Tax=Yersinia intermedia TaxID=631 RepID=UPI001CFF11BF|nr:AAA family ATPase [Yersinia intermedia]MCB5314183.1 AAA family ATPase [Yersinia intermedia]MCB5328037.1 AAA family ATPase [Yersinia intermedia]